MLILGTNAYNPTIMNNTTSGGGSDIPTTLGSRIDNKATVVGVLQDHEGNDYVLAVVDAAYRTELPISWGQPRVDTPLQNNADSTAALADHHTGKYNTDLILSTYIDYPAFNFARNACTVTIGSNTYYSVLPNLNELQMLYDNKDVLDQYDPTVSSYSDRTINDFQFGANGAWSSTEGNYNYAWRILKNNNIDCYAKNNSIDYGVCPVICIPLS
jgi:hypothetical protein